MKGEADPLKIIVGAAIIIIVMVIVLYVFTDLFRKEAGVLREQVLGAQDYDKDGVINSFDPCPCEARAEACTKDKRECEDEIANAQQRE